MTVQVNDSWEEALQLPEVVGGKDGGKDDNDSEPKRRRRMPPLESLFPGSEITMYLPPPSLSLQRLCKSCLRAPRRYDDACPLIKAAHRSIRQAEERLRAGEGARLRRRRS